MTSCYAVSALSTLSSFDSNLIPAINDMFYKITPYLKIIKGG